MNRPVGVALLGTAHMPHAWAYARALTASPRTTLVGVHDPEPGLTRWIQQDFGAAYHSERDALLQRDDVDAVIVCSETDRHRADVESAVVAGLHVLCEKPIATTLEDADAIVRVCRTAGVLLALAFPSRFDSVVARARAAVHGGEVGRVVSIVGGNRGRPPLPPSYPGWIIDSTRAGGGALMDHSVHVTDAMRHVSGLEVTAVSAETGVLREAGGVEDLALLTLRFDGGAVGSIDPSWSVPEGSPSDYDFFLRILGTDGSLEIRDGADTLELVNGREPGLRKHGFGGDPDVGLIEAFAESVLRGALVDPLAGGEDGMRALEVALAGYRSAGSGATVVL